MNLARALDRAAKALRLRPKDVLSKDDATPLVNEIEIARREWHSAQIYFDSVSEPALVDHAIYMVEASQKKYCYLLRQARQQNIHLPSLERIIRRGQNAPTV
jgi:hypothetical protein